LVTIKYWHREKQKEKKKKAGEDELTEGMPGMMSAPFLVFPYDPIIE
jgi:hypothetical protein